MLKKTQKMLLDVFEEHSEEYGFYSRTVSRGASANSRAGQMMARRQLESHIERLNKRIATLTTENRRLHGH